VMTKKVLKALQLADHDFEDLAFLDVLLAK
jgi:hypothetical protein